MKNNYISNDIYRYIIVYIKLQIAELKFGYSLEKSQCDEQFRRLNDEKQQADKLYKQQVTVIYTYLCMMNLNLSVNVYNRIMESKIKPNNLLIGYLCS